MTPKLTTCPRCAGRGELYTTPKIDCPKCNGTGNITKIRIKCLSEVDETEGIMVCPNCNLSSKHPTRNAIVCYLEDNVNNITDETPNDCPRIEIVYE